MHAMCLTLIVLLALLCQTSLRSAETPPPILEITIGDGARLLQHWHGSLFYKTWASPALGSIRTALNAFIEADQGLAKIDPLALLTSLVTANVQVRWRGTKTDPQPETTPELRLQIDIGPQSANMFRLLSDKGTATTLAGADEASLVPDGDYILARFGTVLVLGRKGTELLVNQVPHADHDIDMHYDGAAAATAILAWIPMLGRAHNTTAP